MRKFGTFKGFRNNDDGTTDLRFNNLTNELGERELGELHHKQNISTKLLNLKFDNRYLIEQNDLGDVTKLKLVNKNPKCDIFRRFKDEFHFIGGKYQGKKDKDIDIGQLKKYCIWLGQNTYNEATIKNVLTLLKKIHE